MSKKDKTTTQAAVTIYPEELTEGIILEWAASHADYGALERVAKSMYGIYKARQKGEYPDDYRAAKQYRKQYKQNN